MTIRCKLTASSNFFSQYLIRSLWDRSAFYVIKNKKQAKTAISKIWARKVSSEKPLKMKFSVKFSISNYVLNSNMILF